MEMTNEELAVAIQQGRTELMEQLWHQVERFVIRQASRAMLKLRPGCGVEFEDLTQSGYIALDAAVRTYDPEKGAFITLFARCLDTAFTRSGGCPTYNRNPQAESDPWGGHPERVYHNPLNGSASLNAPLKSSDPDVGVLADVVPYAREDGGDDLTDVEDAIYNEQLHDALDSAIDTLPDAQAAAIRGRYWDDLQYSELAEQCGVSSEQVHRDVRAGIRALRSPSLSRELFQFVEENTDYYAGSGLQSFRNTGSSSVERAAVQRENREAQWRRQHRESREAG